MPLSDELFARKLAKGGRGYVNTGGAGLPAWVSALAAGQWYEIPGSNLSAIEPSPLPNGSTGPTSKVIAWTSMAVDETNSVLYQVAGGGHNDYAGNEVEKLALNVSSPAWVQVLAPTTNANLTETAYYADGRPCSRHHYRGLVWNATDSRIMLVGGSRWGVTSATLRELDSFNIGSGTYSADNTHTNIPETVGVEEVKAMCRDARNDDIYVFSNFNVAKWDQSTNTWSSPVSDQSVAFFSYEPAAFDSTRNKIALLAGTTIEEYDPDANTFTTRTLTGTALGTTTEAAMVYVPAIDSFLLRKAATGGTVHSINASTFAAAAFSTSDGGSIPATSNGPYNKFLYVPGLQGCVYVPSYTGNAWFLRVH